MLRGIACEIDGRWQGPAAVPEGGGKARPQTNVARNFPRSFFETTRKRCNSNGADSRFELLAGELRAKLLCDGRAGSTAVPVNYGAWPRCRWAVGVAQTNFARNSPRSFFETTRKRCNSNGANSRFELLAGELRAKLLCDGRAGSTAVPVNYGAWPRCRGGGGGAWPGFEIDHSEPQARVWRSRGRATAHRHTQRPGPKAGPDGAPQDRHTSGATAGKATTSSPSGPCARGGASRPCRSGCEPRCAAPPPRRR